MVKDGLNIRGVRAIRMFRRNYRKTRLSKNSIGSEEAVAISEEIMKKRGKK